MSHGPWCSNFQSQSQSKRIKLEKKFNSTMSMTMPINVTMTQMLLLALGCQPNNCSVGVFCSYPQISYDYVPGLAGWAEPETESEIQAGLRLSLRLSLRDGASTAPCPRLRPPERLRRSQDGLSGGEELPATAAFIKHYFNVHTA